MKVMKLKFNPKTIENSPIKAYDAYAQNVIKAIKRNAVVDKASFSRELHELADSFINQNAQEQMNKKSAWLAESLVALKADDLAGIVYSFLVKLNYGSPKLREKFAINALAIATRQKDSIHIMARANDLKELYKLTAKGSDKHIKVLYQEKRALQDIIKNYDKLKSERKTIAKDLVPIEGYQKKLAAIKFELGELLMRRDPVLAKVELQESKEIYSQFGAGSYTEKAELLLKKLELI